MEVLPEETFMEKLKKLSEVVADSFAVNPLNKELKTKLVAVQVPHSYSDVKISLDLDSRELEIRLDDLEKCNHKFIADGGTQFRAESKEYHEYLKKLDVFLLESASSSSSSAGERPSAEVQSSVVEGVVLRKFQDGFVSVLSLDSSQEFSVEVEKDFPGLGISVQVGDVLRVFISSQSYHRGSNIYCELICRYRLEEEDAKVFLDNLQRSTMFFEHFSRCHAVWNYILNVLVVKVADKHKIIELCCKVLHICKKAISQHQGQLSVMMKNFWYSFKGSKFLNEVLPSIVKEEQFSSHENMDLVKQFIEYIIQVIPVCGVKANAILFNLNLEPNEDNLRFMKKVVATLALNVDGVKDDPQNLQWNQKLLIPTIREIFFPTQWKDLPCIKVKSDKPGRESKINYSSEEEYLNTNFTLLREECFHNLNDGIRQFIEDGKTDSKNVMMYRISLLKVKSDRGQEGLSFQLEFTRDNTNSARDVDPDNSKWLMRGNLLCISLDNSFQCPIWATVAWDKDKDKPTKEKKVYVILCTDSNSLKDAEVITKLQCLSDQGFEAYMCESSTFYMAFGPALDVLQHKESVPFKEQLVDVNKCSQPPEYLKNIKKRPDWSIIFSKPFKEQSTSGQYSYEQLIKEFTDMKNMSESSIPKLDPKQLDAVEQALCNKLALIQGPPGTGKSYVGEALLQLLLSMNVLEGSVLIVTYKNFALDHFLESCLAKIPGFKSKLVRVGGGGDSEELEECKLYKLSSQKRTKRDIQNQIEKQLEAMQPEIDSCIKLLRYSNRSSNIPTIFNQEASDKHLKSLLESDDKIKRFDKLMRDKDFRVKHNKELLEMIKGPLKKWLPSKEKFLGNCPGINDEDTDTGINVIDEVNRGSDSDNEKDTICETDPIDEYKERCGAFDDDIYELEHQKDAEIIILRNDQDTKDDWILPDISNEKLGNFRSILNAGNIQNLNLKERIQMVYALHGQYYKSVSKKFLQITDDFSKKCQMRKEFSDRHKIDVLKKKGVIGMTVSGAAINASWLETIKPSVMIVEEAAEILEPQLVAIIPSSVQHLIMIGDHQQLSPQVSFNTLANKCNLKVSMFERLITSGKLEYTQLDTQGRMSDEIANLVRKLEIYTNYKTRDEVVNDKCKPLSFLPKSMFFYTHSKKEKEQPGSHSKYNEYEADKVIFFANFLCCNKVAPSRITILCSYRGQMIHIKQIMERNKQNNSVNDIAVATIDSFQGKENDVILLSLVRSSTEKNAKIGYLSSINRICVAVSRARCGLYLFGNSDLLMRNSRKGWMKIIKFMKSKECFGDLEKSIPFQKDVTVADGPVENPGPALPQESNKTVYNVSIHGGSNVVQIGDSNTCQVNTDQAPPEVQQQPATSTEEESGSSVSQSLEETRKSDAPEPEAQQHSFSSLPSQEEPEAQQHSFSSLPSQEEPEAQEHSFSSLPSQEEPEAQQHSFSSLPSQAEPEAQEHSLSSLPSQEEPEAQEHSFSSLPSQEEPEAQEHSFSSLPSQEEPEAQELSFSSLPSQEGPSTPESTSTEETRKSDAPEPEAQELSFSSLPSQAGPSTPASTSTEETRKSDAPEPEAQELSFSSLPSYEGPSTPESTSTEETRKSDAPEPEAQELSFSSLPSQAGPSTPESTSTEETRKSDAPEAEPQELSFSSLPSQAGPSTPESTSTEETRKSDAPEPEAQELSFSSLPSQAGPSTPESTSTEETRKSDAPEAEPQQHSRHDPDASGDTTFRSETHPEQETGEVDKSQPRQETEPPSGKPVQDTNPKEPGNKD